MFAYSYSNCHRSRTINLDLTESQHAFRAEVRAFIGQRLPPEIRDRLRRGHPARKEDTVRWQRILHERRWAAPNWPVEYGGAGLGIPERLILLDEIYRAPAPLPQVLNINMLGPVLLRYGTPEQKRHFLPRLANLDLWFCQGFSEPNAGSDLASLVTRADRVGDHYVVSGRKIWTSTAHVANWIFALVRTDRSARRQDGISLLLIDLASAGISIRPIVTIDGDHHLNEVVFDDVSVPVENLVGTAGQGWECARYILSSERTGIANVGLCRERLDHAREIAAQCRQDGATKLEDSTLRNRLADIAAEIRALELTNWRYLLDPDVSLTNPCFASVLKLKGTELLQATTSLLAQIMGASGFERLPPAGQTGRHPGAAAAQRYFYYRAATIYGGSSEIQKNILARTILN